MRSKQPVGSEFYVAFRINHDSGHQQRHNDLLDAIGRLSNFGFWQEPEFHVAFRSGLPISVIGVKIWKQVGENTDFVLIGNVTTRKVKVIGDVQDMDAFIKVFGDLA